LRQAFSVNVVPVSSTASVMPTSSSHVTDEWQVDKQLGIFTGFAWIVGGDE
jgi:hypothetical protein